MPGLGEKKQTCPHADLQAPESEVLYAYSTMDKLKALQKFASPYSTPEYSHNFSHLFISSGKFFHSSLRDKR